MLWFYSGIWVGFAQENLPGMSPKPLLKASQSWYFYDCTGKALKIWLVQLCDGVTAAESQHD